MSKRPLKGLTQADAAVLLAAIRKGRNSIARVVKYTPHQIVPSGKIYQRNPKHKGDT